MADRGKIFQYLIKVEPHVTPQIVGNAGAPDSVLLTRETLLQYQATTFVSASIFPVVIDWLRQATDPPRSLARPQSEGVLAPFQPAVVTTFLDWDVQQPTAPRVAPRLVGWVAGPPYQPGTDVTRVDWLPEAPTAPLLPPRPIVAGILAPVQPGTDVTRVDWVAASPQAPKVAPRPLTDGTIAPFQPAAAPTVFLEWQVQQPPARAAARPASEGAFVPLPAPPTDLAWQASYPDRLLPLARAATLPWAAPYWVPDVTTPAPTLSWQGYQPAQVWPRVRPFPVALQPTGAASPTMFQSVPPAAVIAGQISVDYPEMPTNMSGGSMLGGFQ